MKVFVCWSGALGKSIADAVETLLKKAFPAGAVSALRSHQIEKGVLWANELRRLLEEANAGIVCLTPENLASPWLHFEAGALAERLGKQSSGDVVESRGGAVSKPSVPLYPLLHHVTPMMVTGPLADYQATTTDPREVMSLLEALAGRAGIDRTKIVKEACDAFAATLAQRRAVRDVVPKFAELFQRMTFEEPIQQCMSQRWLDRHRGASKTRDDIKALEPLIEAGCGAAQIELFRLLESALGSYADAMGSLLMEQRTFPLAESGERELDPAIRRACESRRLRVKDIVRRLLWDEAMDPLTPEAVKYYGAETFEERKSTIHHLENRVRAFREETRSEPHTKSSATLPAERRQHYRGSSWELDRIHYYLDQEYAQWAGEQQDNAEPARDGLGTCDCAIRDVVIELERTLVNPSKMMALPLSHALRALRNVPLPDLKTKRSEIERVLAEVVRHLQHSPDWDKCQRIAFTIAEVRALVEASLDARGRGRGEEGDTNTHV